MKTLTRINILVLILLFLSVGISLGQNIDERFIASKGVEYATQGKFKEAREEFNKTWWIAQPYGFTRKYLEVIGDVNEGRIQKDTAICFFEGVSHSLKNQFAEAISKFEMVIETEPKYAIPYISRGVAYYNKNQ
ncbi:MAG: hypothetical protein ACFFCW_37800, partial [Candidatus Hodarchaeota archaeon]